MDWFLSTTEDSTGLAKGSLSRFFDGDDLVASHVPQFLHYS